MTTSPDTILCTQCGTLNRAAGRSLAGARCGKCRELLAPPEPQEISGPRLRALRERDSRPFVLDVWAPWCGPCRMMAPALRQAAAQLAGEVRFFKLNSDQHPDASAELGVRGIPALFLIYRGRIADQRAGAMPAASIIEFASQPVTGGD